MTHSRRRPGSGLHRLGLFLAVLGPGLITASADNDAPGIATYSMAGSRYGYSFLWLLIVVTVGEVIVQEMAARMGAVTGKGTADLIRERFGVKVTAFAMLCLLVANLGTTMAQCAGVAASSELLGLSRFVAVPLAALAVGLLVLRGNYSAVEKVLLALSLAALAYIISAVAIRPPWDQIAREAINPSLTADPDYILAVMATIGTTITPWGIVYMQAAVADKGVTMGQYKHTRIDVVFGAAWGNIVSAAIIICTAATPSSTASPSSPQRPRPWRWSRWRDRQRGISSPRGFWGLRSWPPRSFHLYDLRHLRGLWLGTWARPWPQRGPDSSHGIYIGIIVVSVVVVLIPGIPLFR